jgi:hypothetical protein
MYEPEMGSQRGVLRDIETTKRISSGKQTPLRSAHAERFRRAGGFVRTGLSEWGIFQGTPASFALFPRVHHSIRVAERFLDGEWSAASPPGRRRR